MITLSIKHTDAGRIYHKLTPDYRVLSYTYTHDPYNLLTIKLVAINYKIKGRL